MLNIVSVNFPFLENKIKKARPALCLTKPDGKHNLVVLAFITTSTDTSKNDVEILKTNEAFRKTGLKHNSVIKLNKLSSVSIENINGTIGTISGNLEKEVKEKLRNMFGI